MMNLNFSVDLFSYLLNFFKGFVCICLFTLSYNKRKYFWLRITACILSGLLLCFLFTLWKLPYDAETTPDSNFYPYIYISASKFIPVRHNTVLL